MSCSCLLVRILSHWRYEFLFNSLHSGLWRKDCMHCIACNQVVGCFSLAWNIMKRGSKILGKIDPRLPNCRTITWRSGRVWSCGRWLLVAIFEVCHAVAQTGAACRHLSVEFLVLGWTLEDITRILHNIITYNLLKRTRGNADRALQTAHSHVRTDDSCVHSPSSKAA